VIAVAGGIPGRTTHSWRKLQAAFRSDCERVDAACWICRQPIDYSAKAGTPDSFEADHVIRPKLRPDLAEVYENLRPSHKACNGRRQTKPAELTGLGMTSRSW
jgi:hypothetical protein